MSSPALAPIPPSEVLHVTVKKLKRRYEYKNETPAERFEKGFYEPHHAGDYYDFGPLREWFFERLGTRVFGLTHVEISFLILELFGAINEHRCIPPVKILAERCDRSRRTIQLYLRALERKVPMLYEVVLSPWLTADQKISILEAL